MRKRRGEHYVDRRDEKDEQSMDQRATEKERKPIRKTEARGRGVEDGRRGSQKKKQRKIT